MTLREEIGRRGVVDGVLSAVDARLRAARVNARRAIARAQRSL